MQDRKPAENLHRTVEEMVALLEHHRALDALAQRQTAPQRGVVEQLQRRQNAVELQRRARNLHPADLAFVIESMPPENRLLIWDALDAPQAAETLVEMDPSVRTSLVNATERSRLTDIASHLDHDDLAWVAAELPDGVMRDVMLSLNTSDRSLLQQAVDYPAGSVGQLMSGEVAAVHETQTVAEVLDNLRKRADLPSNLDRVFVVDARNVLRGAVGLQRLVLGQSGTPIAAIMELDPLAFAPLDTAAQAARAFERYDLVSAPVVNDRRKLVGRLTIDAMVDFIRVTADRDALAMAGLRGGEDLFASVWQSARNRSFWLFLNLVTAFGATRFIGLFESTIQGLVALATLMPVVASIGGNTGNQTIALVIRGMAFEQLPRESIGHLLRKEIVVAVLNGLVWGGLVGVVAGLVYHHARLGMVMTAAIVLNLIVAAAVGVAVPLGLQRMGRDPAQGASVLLTFMTDSMGFFLFLGLARLFL